MPQIPEYSRTDVPVVQQTGGQASPAAAALPAEAVQHLGSEGVDFFQKLNEAQNYDYVANNWADATTKWHGALRDGMDQATQSGQYQGFAKGFGTQMQADLQQRLDAAPTPRAADALRRHFASLTDTLSGQAAGYEHQQTVQGYRANLTTNLDGLATTAYRNPTSAGDLYAQGVGIIDGASQAGIAPGDVEDMKRQWGQKLYSGVLQNGLETNPNTTADALRDGQFDKFLPEPVLAQWQGRLDQEVNRRQAEADRAARENQMVAQADLKGRIDDNLASIARTGEPTFPISPDALRKAWPDDPEFVNGTLKQLSNAAKLYDAGQKVALTSPDEDAALVNGFTPAGSNYQEQAKDQDWLIQQVQAKRQALAKDPAAYIQARSPLVASLFQAAAQDPTKLPAAVNAQDQIYDKLSVPEDQRTVLPKVAAQAAVQNFLSLPADQQAKQWDGMAASYGVIWPRVKDDLVAAKLPTTFEMLSATDDPRTKVYLADAISTGKKQLKAGLSEPDVQQIDRAIDDSSDLFSLAHSMSYADGGAAKAADIKDGIKLLSYRLASTMGALPATKAAIAAFTTDKYDFTPDGARVPKGQLGAIEDAADTTLDGLTPSGLAPAANVTGIPLTPEQLQDTALKSAKGGKWVTNPREDGLMRLGLDGRPILRADGTPLSVGFDQARQAWAARLAQPPGQAYRFEPPSFDQTMQ